MMILLPYISDPHALAHSGKTVTENLDAGPYTAVVYVHGMGDQRRYEELSRLIDSLERYARANEATTGRLDLVQSKLEPPRGELEREVAYVEVLRQRPLSADAVDQSLFRFYEVYWAPIAAEGTTTRDVLGWLIRQGIYPLKTITSPWRDRARLRRAALQELWSARGKNPRFSAQDRDRLITLYDQFDGPEARIYYPKGTFSEFRQFIAETTKKEPRTAERDRLARAWRRWYGFSELRNLFVLLTLLLTLALAVGAVLAGVMFMLSRFPSLTGLQTAIAAFGLGNAGKWQVASIITGGILTLAGLSHFLLNYMGDVQLWTTYEETNIKCKKRQEILNTAVRHLRHVLLDPLCERVAVVAHSLGTTIALDSLLELARANRALSPDDPMGPTGLVPDGPLPLDRIEHFITIASPIDKVYYFFESYKGGRYRYNQIVEDIRGDLGSAPFARSIDNDILPHVHWINFWDQADIIGGSIESPGSRTRGDLRVDNVEVANLRFPNPGASHSAYFDHKRVIGETFAAIFDRKGSMVDPPLAQPYIDEAEKRFLSPGEGIWYTRLVQLMFLVVPWLVLGTIAVSVLASKSGLRVPLLWMSAVGVGLTLAGLIVGKRAGRVEALE